MQYKDLGYLYLGSNVGITAAVFFLPLLLTARNISDLEIGYLAIFYSVALFFSNKVLGVKLKRNPAKATTKTINQTTVLGFFIQ